MGERKRAFVIENTRQPEIAYVRRVFSVEKDVCGLEIAMEDAAAVRMFHCEGNRDEEFGDFSWRNSLARNPLRRVPPSKYRMVR